MISVAETKLATAVPKWTNSAQNSTVSTPKWKRFDDFCLRFGHSIPNLANSVSDFNHGDSCDRQIETVF